MEEYSMFLFGNKEEKKVKKAEEKQIKEYFKNNHDIVVKSRLLCKMLYNVFTISTYQN